MEGPTGGEPGELPSGTHLDEIFRLQHNVDFKRNLILTLQSRCAIMEKAIPALERKVGNAQQECNEKDKTIETLKQHVLELRKRNKRLEMDLMNAYGRLDVEVERYKYCGYGCPKCDQEKLDDLKKLFTL